MFYVKKRQLNILFVCSRNKWRSATAEAIFKNSQSHNIRSAGTEPSAVVKVSEKVILWADIIFVMEKRHKQRLLEKFPEQVMSKKMVVLDIEDNYRFMDPELVEIIKLSVEPFINDL